MNQASIGTLRLRDKVALRIGKLIGAKIGPQEPKASTAPWEFDTRPFGWDIYREEKVRTDRVSVVRDSWNMYLTHDIIRADIDAISEDATESNRNGRPFEIVFRDAEQEEELKDKIENILAAPGIALWDGADEIIRWTLLDGDRLYRIVADASLNNIIEFRYIKGIQQGFITQQLKEGEFKDYYVQYELQSRRPVTVFAPWEVVRFQWNDIGGEYGLPLFSSARRNFNRLSESEKDLYIARKERAYTKMAHIFPDASPEQLEELRQKAAEEQKEHPSGITSDYYATGDVKLIDPHNAALGNISDVEFMERKLLASGRRPHALMGGYGRDVNRSSLDRQEHRYISGLIDKVCRMASKGFRQLIDTQMALWSLLPEDHRYEIKWTAKSVEEKKSRSEWLRDAFDRRVISAVSYAMELGFDHETEKARIEEHREWLQELAEKEAVKLGFGEGEE